MIQAHFSARSELDLYLLQRSNAIDIGIDESMKSIVKKILLTAIILVMPAIATSEDNTLPLTISTGEWPPFISENLKYHGVAARIVTESFASQNINIQYGWFPWKRSYNNVKTGSWDASAIWAITEERKEDVLFSDPVIQNQTVLFFRKDNIIEWQSYKDLSGIIIGATNGYFYGEEFNNAESSGLITVERTSIESNNFKKLKAHRLDAVIAEVDTGYDIMRKIFRAEQIDAIMVSPKYVASLTNHLVISKKLENAEQLISAFNKGLKQLTDSGKVDQYLKESRSGQYQQ